MFWSKHEVINEKLWALRNKLPATLDVFIGESEDGGYVARINNLPGCFTEADDLQKLNEMINEAVYDYFEVPKQYVPLLQSYGPTADTIKRMQERGLPVRGEHLTLQRV